MLVVRGHGLGRVSMADTSQARELIRRIAAINPEIKLSREL
jgi:hypothetical protein